MFHSSLAEVAKPIEDEMGKISVPEEPVKQPTANDDFYQAPEEERQRMRDQARMFDAEEADND